ncbi:unnamed protein product [Ilex paraguariensis]|uniref:Phytocyanin domain-containing protein n=1 Tax=Ilex paraguariensis TaxID=185542 RepID=A0ABC8V132_9AQUA
MLMSLATAALIINGAMATNYTVGGPNRGWDTSSKLQSWATSQTFLVGDNLDFQYTPNHDVLEVSKADYDSCTGSNPLQSYSGGTTTIPLASPGKRYFICGTSGHCSQGMKVEIDTLAASTPPAASPNNPPTAATPTPSPGSPATPPAASPPSETATPPLQHSPAPAPTVANPPSDKSPVGAISPTSLDVPSAGAPETSDSPSGSPPPPSSTLPSSATKVNVMAGCTLVLGFITMLWTL